MVRHPTKAPASTRPKAHHRRIHRLVDPPFLIGALTLVGLLVIWSSTVHLTQTLSQSVARNTATMATDIADTYEALVVRALREIGHTAKLVRYELTRQPPQAVIDDLSEHDLLPPSLLFSVAVLGLDGKLLATHGRHDLPSAEENAFFQRALYSSQITVSQPIETDQGTFLYFALAATQGRDDYVVVLSAPASYFVSSYDTATLGAQGLLGLVGDDNRFRIRRTAEHLSSGTLLGDIPSRAAAHQDDSTAPLLAHPWDQTERYTVVRELYDFPLTIVVGLSKAEHLASARETIRNYYGGAILASTLLLISVSFLGRMSWRLHSIRKQAIDERIQHARNIEYLAFHDSLTDLPNRAFFNRTLTRAVLEGRRYQRQFALLFLDLDGFKHVNDSLGHDAGDDLLIEVARRLTQSVRDSDVVARLGGDEFVVLLPTIGDADKIVPVGEKILAACARPFNLSGNNARISVSIGVTLFPKHGQDEQTLLKTADIAMYHAKQQGKNNVQFYSEALGSEAP